MTSPILYVPLVVPFVLELDVTCSPESRCASAHNFALADELGIEFAAVEGEEDVKVNT